MSSNNYCVITFYSTNYALEFEKKLKSMDILVSLMPIPRQISSSCGTAAKYPCELKEKIIEICIDNNIEYEDFHIVEINSKSSLLQKFFSKK